MTFGQLVQGNKLGVTATDTIDFIFYDKVPAGKKVTYAAFICNYCPLKSEPYRVCIVVGGDKLSYKFYAGSPAVSLIETKLMINSVISDAKQGARYLSANF